MYVAPAARRARQDGLDHPLAPLRASFQELAEEVPPASGTLALPASAVELVAGVEARPALSAAPGVPDQVWRDAADGLRRWLVDAHSRPAAPWAHQSPQALCQALGRRAQSAEDLPGVEQPAGVLLGFEGLEAACAVLTEDLVGWMGKVRPRAVGPALVFACDRGDAALQPEHLVVSELTPIGRQEAQERRPGLAVEVLAEDDAVGKERRADPLLDGVERVAESDEGHGDVDRHENRP